MEIAEARKRELRDQRRVASGALKKGARVAIEKRRAV
jgi:hypothetical protein